MSYRQVLATPGVRPWAIVTLGTRLTVATVPLGGVLLAAGVLDSFAIGGLLAGGYAAGETLLAPVMGRRAQRGRLRRELTLAITAEAALILATLAVLAVDRRWWPVAVATMAAAGGAASGLPGALRSYIAGSVDRAARDRALSVDNIINQVNWLVGPALAAVGSAVISPWAPLTIVVSALVCTLPAVARLPTRAVDSDPGPRETLRTPALLRRIILPIVASALIMASMATLDVLIPARVAADGVPPVLSGLALGGLAAAAMVASALYGARRWPGSPTRHAQVGLLAIAVLVWAIGISGPAWLALSLCVAVGFAEAPALLGRNIALTEQIPEDQWTVGFSLLYSAAGLGYTAGATIAGQVFEHVGVGAAFEVIGVMVVALGTLTMMIEGIVNRRRTRQTLGG